MVVAAGPGDRCAMKKKENLASSSCQPYQCKNFQSSNKCCCLTLLLPKGMLQNPPVWGIIYSPTVCLVSQKITPPSQPMFNKASSSQIMCPQPSYVTGCKNLREKSAIVGPS